MSVKNKPKLKDLLKHETKKHSIIKFIGLIILVIVYTIFMSVRFGTREGLFVTALTWAFFIFCTPIADAGFILAFPARLIAGIRMIYTQIFSFILALVMTLYAFFFSPKTFDTTIILKLYHQIISQPWPFWTIILLSLAGTVMSIYFGDELIDVSSHKERDKYHKHLNKYQIIIFIFLISITIILYNFLLQQLNINIPL